jgi:hypothetical protein
MGNANKELTNPGEEFSGNEYFRSMSTSSFDFYVGGMMPGTYRMRVQAINHELDKPVKSNSVRFTVSESSDPAWQIGGENYDDIQSCTIYECPCAVIGGCYNGGVNGQNYLTHLADNIFDPPPSTLAYLFPAIKPLCRACLSR